MTDILLGHDRQTNKEVTVKPWEYALGGYFIGTRRMGKSTLLESLCVQSMKNGHGMTLIDPHGDLLNAVLNRIPQHRLNDVILFDPKDYQFPFGLNIYHCEDKNDPLAVEYTVNLVLDLYKKLWKSEYSQPMVEDIILMTTLTIIANDMTMVEVPKLLFDDAFRQRLLKNVRNPDVLDFWKIYDNPRSIEREQGGGTVGRRLRPFTTSGIMRYIFGQNQKILQLREVLDKKKILLIRLYSDLPQLTSLIGSTVVSQMLQAALSRSDTNKRPEHHLYCDEYSRFAVESFAQIIEEAGKYQIIPFIAHQSTGQISEENQDSAIQLGNLFCFRLIGRDAEKLAGEFNLTPPPANEREKTIPSDVLMHLSDHPNQHVKDFERSVVRKLLQAKALRTQDKDYKTHPEGGGMEIFEVTRTETIYPKFTFDDVPISFNPDDLLKLLDVMETFLFDVMIHKNIDMDQFNKNVLLWWAYCCSGMYIPDPKRHIRKDYSKYLDPDYERRDQRDISERYERFKLALLRVAAILEYEPIKVFPSTRPEENTSQQTYADRRNQIANELVGLSRGQAQVKLPNGEYLIKTIPSTTAFTEGQKRTQVVEQTREKYCTPRAEVEEQIRQRQENDTPSTIKRTHTL